MQDIQEGGNQETATSYKVYGGNRKAELSQPGRPQGGLADMYVM